MKIALVGYMGSGKTFWAKKLAEALKINYLDLDEVLEQDFLKMPISTFIQLHGELAFRKKERAALEDIAQRQVEFVLATGGGTPCYYQNMDVLNRHFKTIYLQAGVQLLYNRLVTEKADRPLIAHVEDIVLKEFIAKHLFERRMFYEQAHHIIKAETLNLEQLLELSKHEK